MSTRWLTSLAMLAWLSPGCAPFLYYQVRQTRSYEYDKGVTLLVNSSPAGATIVAANGRILGQAPLLVDEAVRVRREHRYCSTCMAIVGCVVDLTAMGYGITSANEHPDSHLAQAAGVVGAGMGLGCIALAIGGLITKMASTVATPPEPSLLSPIPSNQEVAIEHNIELVARWDGLGESRANLVLPGTRTTTLRLPRRNTFDEAVVLWAQETSPPATAENLFAIGSAYLGLFREGVSTARGHARRYLSRYVELYSDGDHAPAARLGLSELESSDRKAQ